MQPQPQPQPEPQPEPEPVSTSSTTVTFSVEISNLVYSTLTSTKITEIQNSIKLLLSNSLNVSPSTINVTLSSGSTIIKVDILKSGSINENIVAIDNLKSSLPFISDFILNDVKIITNRNDLILNNNYAGNKITALDNSLSPLTTIKITFKVDYYILSLISQIDKTNIINNIKNVYSNGLDLSNNIIDVSLNGFNNSLGNSIIVNNTISLPGLIDDNNTKINFLNNSNSNYKSLILNIFKIITNDFTLVIDDTYPGSTPVVTDNLALITLPIESVGTIDYYFKNINVSNLTIEQKNEIISQVENAYINGLDLSSNKVDVKLLTDENNSNYSLNVQITIKLLGTIPENSTQISYLNSSLGVYQNLILNTL